MTLKDWLNSGWLTQHETTPDEMAGFLALADRDIHDAQTKELSEDWQFNIAYNAALQLANAALAGSGFRVGRGGSHHHHAIQSLSHSLGATDKSRRASKTAEKQAENLSPWQQKRHAFDFCPPRHAWH